MRIFRKAFVIAMRKEYDFSKSRKNPYAKLLKKQITIRLEEDVIAYFKKLAGETGIPYQNLTPFLCFREGERE